MSDQKPNNNEKREKKVISVLNCLEFILFDLTQFNLEIEGLNFFAVVVCGESGEYFFLSVCRYGSLNTLYELLWIFYVK